MSISRVYSYLRFSDPKQAAGSSADRQIQYAVKWAEDHGLVLDDTLSLRDEGLSAYHQQHIKQGALGVFMLAIHEGRIAPGSVLVVEGLDRLSRAEPIQAQAQLAQIVNAGITVVTASDGREYNREKLKAQPMDLVYSLLVMIRAHEESDTKSKRVKAAIRRQCQGWIAGTYRGIIRNGKDPHWVRWNGEEFEIAPEQAEAVKLAIQLFKEGNGGHRMVMELEKRGLEVTQNGSTASHLYKMLKRKDLIGVKSFNIGGEEFELKDYYPRLISDNEFAELQAAGATRIKRKGKGEVPGIMTGIGVMYCGYCGSAVVAQNTMNRRRRPDGMPNDGHRRLHCCGYNTGGKCMVGGSISVVPVEKALLSYCSDQFNLAALMGDEDMEQPLRDQLHATVNSIADMERQLARVTEAMLADDAAAPVVFVRKARELEAGIAEAKDQQNTIEVALRTQAARQTPDMADAWAAIVEGTLNLDYATRMQCRKLVQETFDRIVIYHKTTAPEDSDGTKIDLLLIAKGGSPRALRINKKTGAWVAGEEIAA